MNQKTVHSFPLTLARSPVENVSSWKINCGGRGDNRKRICSFISDRVKYNDAGYGAITWNDNRQFRGRVERIANKDACFRRHVSTHVRSPLNKHVRQGLTAAVTLKSGTCHDHSTSPATIFMGKKSRCGHSVRRLRDRVVGPCFTDLWSFFLGAGPTETEPCPNRHLSEFRDSPD